MDTAPDVFQSLILREVLLADGLQGDIQRAKLADWLGEKLAQPSAVALNYLIRLGTKGIVSLPSKLTKQAIINFFQSNGSLYTIRATRGILSRLLKDREHTAHSYCRTALCYAVQGKYEDSESWLLSAEERVADLARPNYIRGLMLGAQEQLDEAAKKLEQSLRGRAKKETKERIEEAIRALTELRESRAPTRREG